MSPMCISGLSTPVYLWGGSSVDALCRLCKSRERLWVWWPLWRCREVFSPQGRKKSPCLGPCLELFWSRLDALSCSAAPMVLCRPYALRCETLWTRIPPRVSARAYPSCWWTRWLFPEPSRCCPSPPHPSCGVRRYSSLSPASRRWCQTVLGCLATWKSGYCSAQQWDPLRGWSSLLLCSDPGWRDLERKKFKLLMWNEKSWNRVWLVIVWGTHYILLYSSSSPTLDISESPSACPHQPEHQQ